MGALTSNRKRGDEFFGVTPSRHFAKEIDFRVDRHISKKPKFSVTNLSPDQPVTVKNTASRVYKYPEPTNKFKREVHAPCRAVRFGFSASLNRDSGSRNRGVRGIEHSGYEMGNLLSKYHQAKSRAFNTFGWTKGKEVVEVEPEPSQVVVSDDSSVEEVEVLDDGREGGSVVSADSSHENDTIDVGVRKVDAKVVLSKHQPSYSSMVSDLTNGDLKVENAEKMLTSLSLVVEPNVFGTPLYKSLLETTAKRDARLGKLSSEIQLNERRLSFYSSLRPAKKPEVIPHEPFVPLTVEEEAEVAHALSNANRRKILVTHQNSNIEITGETLQCLRSGAWLNDEVINVYLELLKEREKREPAKFLKCHFFNTFFYKKLISGKNGYDFKSVRRWTTQRKLGYGLIECDKIFVPIHLEVHWCLAVINKKDEKFQYLDSLGGIGVQVLRVLARYFVDEVKDKSGKDIDVSSWDVENVEDLPHQENGSDCGVFMIKYTDFYSRGLSLCFNQEHMPYFRKRTAKEILRLRAD
ncbi:Ulp1 protease family, C-terminal catalytic domain [Dillenia turbinata]|uniref:Ulp1 protease family, C-terminal catalytic domain n=1 Tax=Dillenia turbinata TaxID=194707 RepID=A0AAN8VM17_9MAGN